VSNTQKEGILKARCSIEMQDKVKQKADEKSLKSSELIRRLVQAGLREDCPVFDVLPLVEQLTGLQKKLAPISSNLNQIAKAYHIEGHLNDEKIMVVLENLKEQQKLVATNIKELQNEFKKITG